MGARVGELVQCVHHVDAPNGCGTNHLCKDCVALRTVLSAMAHHETRQSEADIFTTDGSQLEMLLTAIPFGSPTEPFCAVVIKNIHQEREQALLERVFFHDILNTAGLLWNYAQLLEDNPLQTANIRMRFGAVADQLMNEILSRRELVLAESEQLDVQLESVNASVIVDELVQHYHLSNLGQQKIIDADIPIQNQHIQLHTDKTILKRVLGNMLKNVLEASPNGTKVTIGFKINYEGNKSIRFFVHNPTVISQDVQSQIFQRLFSTKGEGRGLGTYSMKLLSEKYLQGHVSFESNKNDGTTFYAEYPLNIEGA